MGDGTTISKKTASDEASQFTAAVNELSLVKDKELSNESILKAQSVYDGLSAEAKAKVSESSLKKLENYKSAYTLAGKFDALKNVKNYDNLSEDDKTALGTAYADAKAAVAALSDATTIRDILPSSLNLNWYYKKCASIFEA